MTTPEGQKREKEMIRKYGEQVYLDKYCTPEYKKKYLKQKNKERFA